MPDNEIIYGKNAVLSALEQSNRRVNKIFILKGIKYDEKIKEILSLARDNKILYQDVPKEKLNQLTNNQNHQGIALSIAPIEYMQEDEFYDYALGHQDALVVILDGVEDPHNLGAIIRTAVCAGALGIIIPKRRNAQITSITEKTSAGAINKIPIIQVSNLNNTIEKLKKINFWIIGAEADGDKYYYDVNYNMNTAIILGGEGKGLSQLVKKNCDILVKIPMLNTFNSLNVSNAASIVIYETVKQKLQKIKK